MATNTITGADTLTLYGRNLVDLASGDVSTITFNNNRVDMKTGKSGNTVYARNATGSNAELTLKLNRGSADDVFMQTQLTASTQNFASTILAAGRFVKMLGDGLGNIKSDVYTLEGGMFTREVDTKDNTDADIEQAIATYRMMFARATRSIQ